MQPERIYIFDSSTANEAAMAVVKGQFDSIIHYHSHKHNHMNQKMTDRESKLARLSELAQIANINPPPAPPTMHHMTNANQQPQQRPYQPPPPTQPHQLPPPPQSMLQQPQPQPPPPPPQSQQQHEQPPLPRQQHLDPLSSLAAMSECPNIDSYGHTVHHHPPN